MTIEEEMKIWEDRSNDEFGKILKALKELTKDYFVAEEDEFGISRMPLDVILLNILYLEDVSQLL